MLNFRVSVITIASLLMTACLTGKQPLEIELVPRSAEQMSAFYEARGFPRRMIDLLAATCYMTVRIKNTSQDVIWLELAQWQFTSGGVSLHRFHRNEWLQRWQTINVPLRFQSTFRWTLLPESLDYQPGEEEGGNIILTRTDKPITLQARFPTAQDKQGEAYRLTIKDLHCAEDEQ